MATAAPTPAQAELISSLTQDEIPIKLRCAICSKLAVNAFRLPCCEQAICESCHSSLSSSCPVCEHTPIASEDCKPHKSLRTTIKVFLRTEEKKREASKAKEQKDTPPITPVEPQPPVVEIPVETPSFAVQEQIETPVEEQVETTNNGLEEEAVPINENGQHEAASLEEQQDIPQQSVEEILPGQEPNEDATDADAVQGANEGEEKAGDENTQTAMPGFGNGFGFDNMAPGAFSNIGMNGTGDFNQMQMMMAMQNGMAPNGFGSFPMMGMPGMSMDPMAMQFMNGGFGGGMGMMGMGDFNGNMMGNNFNGGNWNSTQQTWNHGNQNNFNQANAVAGAHGDFGAAAHHQNFPAARGNFRQQYNDFSQNNAYGWRGGRGRGRGTMGGAYGGRGNFHGTNFGDQAIPNHFGSGGANAVSDPTIPTGPKADSVVSTAANVDEFGREARTTSEKPLDPNDSGDVPQDQESAGVESTDPHNEQAANMQDGGARPIQTLDEAESINYNGGYPQDFSNGHPFAYQAQARHGWHNGYNSMPPPVVPDVPVNAPTGPKAMREGNMNGRGRGFSIVGRGGRMHSSAAQEVHSERSTSRTAEPEREKEKEKEKEKSRSRSGSRSRKEEDKASEAGSRRERRRHRHRSNSPSEDSEERERRRERRRRRERKYEDEEVYDDEKEESKTREASPAESRRSSHRSRRDRDKDRERDRDYKSSRSHRSSHRSHRDRSRDRSREHRSRRHHEDDDGITTAETEIRPDEDKGTHLSKSRGDRDRERDKDRDSKSGRDREDRDKDRDRSSRHGRSHRDEERSSRHGTSHRERERSDRESDRPRRKDSERERDREREREPSSKVAPTVDPHTLEREARNRERLLKEAQRIAGLASIAGVGSKRGRDDHEGGSGRRSKHRRRSGGLNYDGAGDEPDEERIARGESKRELSRWE